VPSLSQAEQPQLSQPFLPAEGFQPLDQCWGLLWPRSSRSKRQDLEILLQGVVGRCTSPLRRISPPKKAPQESFGEPASDYCSRKSLADPPSPLSETGHFASSVGTRSASWSSIARRCAPDSSRSRLNNCKDRGCQGLPVAIVRLDRAARSVPSAEGRKHSHPFPGLYQPAYFPSTSSC